MGGKNGGLGQLSLDGNHSWGLLGGGGDSYSARKLVHRVLYMHTSHDILFDVMGAQVCHQEFSFSEPVLLSSNVKETV